MNQTEDINPGRRGAAGGGRDVELQLCEYLDGTLSRRERLALERRLEADEALREELRRYGMLAGLLDELAAGEIDGVDYDLQRAEIITAIERKALLNPPRRRARLLRPRFWVTAAAATVLLAASAALVVLALHWSRPQQPVAMMVMFGVTPPDRGARELSVETAPPDLDDLPLELDAADRPPEPAGTIAVSFGAPPGPPRRAADAMVVY